MTGRLVDMAFTSAGNNGSRWKSTATSGKSGTSSIRSRFWMWKSKSTGKSAACQQMRISTSCATSFCGDRRERGCSKAAAVVSYGALARDKDGKPVGLKLPPTADPSDFYPYVRLYETRKENGKDYSCYFVYKESHKMDSKEFARLVDGAIEEAKELGIQTVPRNSWLVTKKNGQNDRKGKIMNTYGARPEVIAIPVDEYKELLAANTELKIIYHKLESCAITTEKYTFHEFVQNMHDALHSVELDAEAPAPVIPGMVEPLAAMHAQGAERLTDAEQL